MKTYAAVLIGDELLRGDTVDTNSHTIRTIMSQPGLELTGLLYCPDDPGMIQDAVSWAARGADCIIISGGLGPTEDDVTRMSVAAWAGKPLVFHQDVWERISKRLLAVRGFVPEKNRRQAYFPEDAVVVPNRHGTADGFIITVDGTTVCCLPGVPFELELLLQDMFPLLALPMTEPDRVLGFSCSGIGEAEVDSRVQVVLNQGEFSGKIAKYGITTAYGVHSVRISVVCSEIEDILLERLSAAFDDCSVVLAGSTIAGDLLQAAATAGLIVAVAESCTGGLTGSQLTAVPGSSRSFAGGVIAYQNTVKVELLSVDPETLRTYGAVSEPCAVEMAQGVQRLLGAQLSVAITGIAGPDGGSAEKPVGTVCFAVVLDGEPLAVETAWFPGERNDIRLFAANRAIFLLHRVLTDHFRKSHG